MFISAKAMWAQLRQPNEMSGKLQIDLTQLSEKDVAALKEEGIKVRNGAAEYAADSEKYAGRKDYGFYVVAKANPTFKDKATGEDVPRKIKIVDAYKKDIPEDVLIGNGSEVVAKVNVFEWAFKGKKGKSLGLQALMVKNLVEYQGADPFAEIEVEMPADENGDEIPF